ncbi:phage repressor protein [Rahnella aquatilis]|nr:phage repressor protein [Rahnella aquatilis]
MSKFIFNFDGESAPVLDRVLDAYGFGSKILLAEHLGIASSSLAGRYKRGGFPADIVVRCVAETGANLEWLATGHGKKFEDSELDIMRFPRKKLIEGQLYESGYLLFDKVLFLPGSQIPEDPICVIDGSTQFIVEQKFPEIYDGEWLVDIEGKVSIRTLTRVPVKRVRVSGVGMAFDCNLDDIIVFGRVVMTCK